jgi:hypothetical protein
MTRCRLMILQKRERLRRPRLTASRAGQRSSASAPADLSQQFDQQRPLRSGQSRV